MARLPKTMKIRAVLIAFKSIGNVDAANVSFVTSNESCLLF
jgi:hypothetical protein